MVNELRHLIIYCLNCIRPSWNATCCKINIIYANTLNLKVLLFIYTLRLFDNIVSIDFTPLEIEQQRILAAILKFINNLYSKTSCCISIFPEPTAPSAVPGVCPGWGLLIIIGKLKVVHGRRVVILMISQIWRTIKMLKIYLMQIFCFLH